MQQHTAAVTKHRNQIFTDTYIYSDLASTITVKTKSLRHAAGYSGAIQGLHTVPHLARSAEPLASWLSWYKASKNLVGDLQHFFWRTKQTKLFSNCRRLVLKPR